MTDFIKLIVAVLQDQKIDHRVESVSLIRFTGRDEIYHHEWKRIMIVVENDMIYGIKGGHERVGCFSNPTFDLEDFIGLLRND